MTIYVVISSGGAVVSAHRTYKGAEKVANDKPYLRIETVTLQE